MTRTMGPTLTIEVASSAIIFVTDRRMNRKYFKEVTKVTFVTNRWKLQID